MATVITRPPHQIDAGPIVLRRQAVRDADAIAKAVERNLDHLRPWMSWAVDPSGHDPDAQRARLRAADEAWERGDDFGYQMLDRAHGTVVGSCGLHRRIGPGGIEIGYWVDAGHVRRGYATAAAGALTTAALALSDVQRVEIHCDEANTPSAAVARRLGYRLDRVEDGSEAPEGSGRSLIWVLDRVP